MWQVAGGFLIAAASRKKPATLMVSVAAFATRNLCIVLKFLFIPRRTSEFLIFILIYIYISPPLFSKFLLYIGALELTVNWDVNWKGFWP